jgi:hypothetical protein
MVGPEMLQEMENMVRKVQQNLKEAQDSRRAMQTRKEDTWNFKWETMFI